jgi:hypothetical protein
MKMTWEKIVEDRSESKKLHSPPDLARRRVRFTKVVGVSVGVVYELALVCGGGVSVSELCFDDGAVGFNCAMGPTGGGFLRCIGMAGKGTSARPPSITPSRCAVCGTGFSTPLWVVSGVIVGRKVVVVVVLWESCLAGSSGESSVGEVDSRLVEVELGVEVVVLKWVGAGSRPSFCGGSSAGEATWSDSDFWVVSLSMRLNTLTNSPTLGTPSTTTYTTYGPGGVRFMLPGIEAITVCPVSPVLKPTVSRYSMRWPMCSE